MDDILKQLLQEEQELQFTKFNEDVAWKLGSQLVETARNRNLPVTIDITRGTHQLCHAALRGTSPDNDEWAKRKVRTVYRFGHSSFYIGQLLKSKGKSIEQAYLVSESRICPAWWLLSHHRQGYWHCRYDHGFGTPAGRRSQTGRGNATQLFGRGEIRSH